MLGGTQLVFSFCMWLPRGIAFRAMQQFHELGSRVDCAWEAADFSEQAFPLIAREALAAERLPDRITSDDVLQWVLAAKVLPAQEDLRASFGQPPITVYRGRRFHIQVLYWLDGSTTIHRHGFCGAFQVLEGGSLHSRWSFSTRHRVNSRMLIGQTHFLGADLLHRGDVVCITPELTHGLFHLEAPSATIVVRTEGETADGPQYEYHPPSIALDPFFVDPLVERQLQALHLLRASGHKELEDRVANLVSRTDVYTVFRIFFHALRDGATMTQLETLADAARIRHGDVVDEIMLAIGEGSRRRLLHSLRRQIREPDGRFFLALLQNLPDRDAIYRVIRDRHPGSASLAIVRSFLAEYSHLLGVDISGDLERIIVESMLEDATDDVIFAKLGADFDEESIVAQRANVLRQVERIRHSLLAPLFVRGAS